MGTRTSRKNQTGGGEAQAPANPPKNGMHDRGRDESDPQILADEEHAELHARVLRVVAGHQLTLRLGQIERQAAHLGAATTENCEPGELRQDEPGPLLGQDDVRAG